MTTATLIDVRGDPNRGNVRPKNASSTCSVFTNLFRLVPGLLPTPKTKTMVQNTPVVVQVGCESFQSGAARKYLADINNLWEPYIMTEEEVAYFQRERSTTFVPLTPDQTRLLPLRKK
jgi:hypothetical protein